MICTFPREQKEQGFYNRILEGKKVALLRDQLPAIFALSNDRACYCAAKTMQTAPLMFAYST